ncbi:hypothetical protein B0T17DRAFT_621628 [Bombardia bombarda]|uniref:Uncharacterized protein n=1 Tax=Bombardia bombarda TaxID=252184 RepID=A0AA39U275_9PEZI|nr:hypothetical protein B0T17DRAFT_621628 [Bombardia bombarda]
MADAAVAPSPTSAHHPEKTAPGSSGGETGHSDEPKPHLHAKTFLAVFAVCSIYFVQIYNVVGAGAVSAYIAQLSTPPELIAITSGLIIGVRSLGGSVGLAIYNALFTKAVGKLGDNIAAAVIPLGLPFQSAGPFIGALAGHADGAVLFHIPGVTPQIVGAGVAALKDTFMTGFKHVWITAAAFSAFAALLSVFLKDPRSEFNMHIDRPVEKDEELYSDRSS